MQQSAFAKKRSLAAATALAIVAPFAVHPARAQQIDHATGPLPSFEVATVTPLKPEAVSSTALIAQGAATGSLSAAPANAGGEKIRQTTSVTYAFIDGPMPDRILLTAKAKSLIARAYGLPMSSESRVVGGPGWIDSDEDRYRMEGKIDDADYAALQKMSSAEQSHEIEGMEQALLQDRFGLKVHFETRDLPVYTLTIARGGPKMKQATADEHPRLMGKGDGQSNTLTATDFTMAELVASPLLRPDGRLVLDRTGLTGAYDFTLKSSTGMDGGSDNPSLFTAMKEQLGLQLVSTKAPVEVIVIDHIERPGADSRGGSLFGSASGSSRKYNGATRIRPLYFRQQSSAGTRHAMKKLATLAAAALTVLSTGAFAATYTGYVADAMCAKNPHKVSSADHAACAKKCISGGEKPVLVVADKTVYTITNPEILVPHAGEKVTVEGSVKNGALTVASVK